MANYWETFKDNMSSGHKSLGKGDIAGGVEKLSGGTGLSGGFSGGFLGGSLGEDVGWSDKKVKAKEDDAAKLREEQNAKNMGVLDQMKLDDSKYYDRSKANASGYLSQSQKYGNDYLSRVGELEKQSADQAKNAEVTYTTNIQPKQKELMESAMNNARGAMTLEEAQDPNNRVASGVRDLYNKEGQSIRNQGMTDAGVLAALGAQATAGQLGGMPVFTGSNLQTMNAQNQRQSGEAFAAAQKRMMDLREQGLGKGLEQSNAMYDRGQLAQGAAANRVSDYEQGHSNFLGQQQGFRGEAQGYAADRMGVQRGMAGEEYDINQGLSGLQHGLQTGQGMRDMGQFDSYYGGQQQGITNQMNRIQADNAQRWGLATTVGSAVAGGMGAPQGGVQTGMYGVDDPYQRRNGYSERGMTA